MYHKRERGYRGIMGKLKLNVFKKFVMYEKKLWCKKSHLERN